jgi:hypothetical protein
MPILGVSKKTEKPRKPEKKLLKKPNREKNRLNRLKFWKNRPVRFGFGFINLKPKKPKRTEPKRKKPSQTGKKPSQNEKTEPNRFEPVFVLKKLNRNRSVCTGFRLVIFLYKNWTEPKMITHSPYLGEEEEVGHPLEWSSLPCHGGTCNKASRSRL